MKRLGAALFLLFGCTPELPLPPGGICLDVSKLEGHQAEALLVASERWEPHFEPVRITYDPACGNHAWNDKGHPSFDGSDQLQMATVINRTPSMERADTQLLLNPRSVYNQPNLEDAYTHEFAHIFGKEDHWGELMADRPALGTGLFPTEGDRAHVGKLYR